MGLKPCTPMALSEGQARTRVFAWSGRVTWHRLDQGPPERQLRGRWRAAGDRRGAGHAVRHVDHIPNDGNRRQCQTKTCANLHRVSVDCGDCMPKPSRTRNAPRAGDVMPSGPMSTPSCHRRTRVRARDGLAGQGPTDGERDPLRGPGPSPLGRGGRVRRSQGRHERAGFTEIHDVARRERMTTRRGSRERSVGQSNGGDPGPASDV